MVGCVLQVPETMDSGAELDMKTTISDQHERNRKDFSLESHSFSCTS